MPEPDEVKELAVKYDTPETRFTYEDYCRMPAGLRYELVEGDLRMVPSPSVSHQTVSKRFQRLLMEWIEDQGLGEVYNAPIDVVLDQHNVVQPDLLYISRERSGIITKANIQGAPDLVVEILSPSTTEWDRVTKRRAYERYGVRELWVVDPEGQSIEVAARKETRLETLQVYPRGTTMVSPILPGFALDVDQLFR